MKHFEYFPRIEYSDNISVNMLVRSKIRNLVLNESSLYYEYTLKDSDRPDIIATKYYGNPDYTWVLFYTNEIKNPLTDWPLDYLSFSEYIKRKYGNISTAKSQIHHYLLDEKYVIDKKTFDDINVEGAKRIIYAYEHEENLNEEKRDIKILDAKYISRIREEIRNIFK